MAAREKPQARAEAPSLSSSTLVGSVGAIVPALSLSSVLSSASLSSTTAFESGIFPKRGVPSCFSVTAIVSATECGGDP